MLAQPVHKDTAHLFLPTVDGARNTACIGSLSAALQMLLSPQLYLSAFIKLSQSASKLFNSSAAAVSEGRDHSGREGISRKSEQHGSYRNWLRFPGKCHRKEGRMRLINTGLMLTFYRINHTFFAKLHNLLLM